MKPILTLVLHGLLVGASLATAESRPNIILIISDDQSFTDYGFMGNGMVKTPHLDRMASESLLYTRGYVMPVCSPSLACLLTGKLPHEHGITGNDLKSKNPNAKAHRGNREPLMERLLQNTLMLPRALTEAGYLTMQTGKLWNATYKDLGFTHGMTTTQGRHGGAGLTIGREGMEPIYQFIETARQQQRPFFVWYAPLMPHDPHTPPERILKNHTGKGPTRAAEKFHAMIEWFDETCGELDQHLSDKGLKDNTVIIYLADNGWNGELGYQGGRAKLSPYDGGIRTPIFIRWPNHVKAQRDNDTLASIIDIAPTILNLANAPAPKDLSGINLIRREAMTARKSVFAEAYTHDIVDLAQPPLSLTARIVIHDRYKLILPGQAKPDRPFATTPEQIELFDLKADPLEQSNLAAHMPDKVAELMAIQNTIWKAE